MDKKIVLFGAGACAERFKLLMDFLEIDFEFYVDNATNKVGTKIYGKEVIAPEQLLNKEYNIIISSMYVKSIQKQLENMGLSQNIIEHKELLRMGREKVRDLINVEEKMVFEKKIILDMYNDADWAGGGVIWTMTVANAFYKNGYHINVFCSEKEKKRSINNEDILISFSQENFYENVIKEMINRLPFVLINSYWGYTYFAALMIKMFYPDMVKIIDVIHGDEDNYYNIRLMNDEWIDGYICVSNKIKNKVINEYRIEEKKVFFKEQPINVEEGYSREYNRKEPLRIGYAARLVRYQKRADLFPVLIQLLEKMNISYQLTIAGIGECLGEIKEFVKTEGLENKINIVGWIEHDKMLEFWKEQDVYLNFSEFEGTSLAMLEAMAYSCVPVVTNVSGVNEFVVDNQNGYIREVGDLQGIAEALKTLDDKRENLEIFGNCCREQVEKRCGIDNYLIYIQDIMKDIN